MALVRHWLWNGLLRDLSLPYGLPGGFNQWAWVLVQANFKLSCQGNFLETNCFPDTVFSRSLSRFSIWCSKTCQIIYLALRIVQGGNAYLFSPLTTFFPLRKGSKKRTKSSSQFFLCYWWVECCLNRFTKGGDVICAKQGLRYLAAAADTARSTTLWLGLTRDPGAHSLCAFFFNTVCSDQYWLSVCQDVGLPRNNLWSCLWGSF